MHRATEHNARAVEGLAASVEMLATDAPREAIHDRWSAKRVDDKTRERLRALLEPGDVLVTRHEIAMSNLFFPGYWPHAALYVGMEQDRERLGVTVDDEVARHWRDDRCVLEALKDGRPHPQRCPGCRLRYRRRPPCS